MNLRLTDGTTVRSNATGLEVTNGDRRLHMVGTAAGDAAYFTGLLAKRGFEALWAEAVVPPASVGCRVRLLSAPRLALDFA